MFCPKGATLTRPYRPNSLADKRVDRAGSESRPPDSTDVEPHPVAPGPPGSTPSKLLQSTEVAPWTDPPTEHARGPDGPDVLSLRRVGCPQEGRRRLHPPRRARRPGQSPGPHLRHHDRRTAGAGRLAGGR